MSDEFEAKESSVRVEKVEKVELHFHLSLTPVPAWASGGPNAPRFYGEPPRKSGWVAKSFGVLALVSVAVVGFSLVYRASEGRGQAELVSALALARLHKNEPVDLDDRVWRPDAVTEAPKIETPHIVEEAPRRGSAAFGLR